MTERELPENIGLPDKNLELIKQPNEIKENKLGGIDNSSMEAVDVLVARSSGMDTAQEIERIEQDIDNENIPQNNYFALFFKGFLLNFINIGVLGFWLMIIITYGPQMEMKTERISWFFAAILFFYLLFDVAKIILAKQLKNKLTPQNIYKIKRVISIVIIVFGVFFILQGVFPKEKEKIQEKLEQFKN